MGCRNSNTKNIEPSPFVQGIPSHTIGHSILSSPFTQGIPSHTIGHPIPFGHSVPYHRTSHPFKSLRTGHFVPYYRAISPLAQGIPSHTIGPQVPSHSAFRSIPSNILFFFKYNYKISNQVPSYRAFRPILSNVVSFQVSAYGYSIPSHRASSLESNELFITKKKNKFLLSIKLLIIKRRKSFKIIEFFTNKRIKFQRVFQNNTRTRL